jgi:hypothetical protein
MFTGVTADKKAGRLVAAEKAAPLGNPSRWEERALGFGGYIAPTEHLKRILGILDVRPDWTVLDMWHTQGLAIPLARRAERITAVDYSMGRCDALSRRCREKGVTNVTPILGRWDDDLASLGIGAHDVVIASWPFLISRIPSSILQVNRAARKRAYVFTTVGDGPFDRRIFEATGRTLEPGPSYTDIYYNIIHQHLGILANIIFVKEDRPNGWDTIEEAMDAQMWMFHNLTEEEERKVKAFLHEHLVHVEGRWALPYKRECHWAVLWWTKEGGRDGVSRRGRKARTPEGMGRMNRKSDAARFKEEAKAKKGRRGP